ncbi:MAG: hypothetical protein JWN94_3846 [Betaproteobacteria bacterium]|nr:hypothetical protein [Betaproteobacteria bacterium]
MKRRLYFMLPDVMAARRVLDTLLLERIESRHIRFLAKRGMLPNDLPEAGVLQKTDLVHGAAVGFVIGGLLGATAGTWLLLTPIDGVALKPVVILIATLFGALFGTWVSAIVGSQVANSQLEEFHPHIASGKLLLMIDVPSGLVSAIRKCVSLGHPEADFRGVDPTVPAFL